MSADLIKRLRVALQQAVDCLSLEVILQGRDPDLREWNAAIAEADAHLSSAGQSREAWLDEALNKLDTYTQSCSQSGVLMSAAKRELFAHLRSVPDTPELVAAHARENAKMMPLLIDVKYALEKARIWNGTGYTYNSLPAFVYEPIYDRVVAALQPKEPNNV